MRLHMQLCAILCVLFAASCAHRSATVLPQVPQLQGSDTPASGATVLTTLSTSPYTYAGCRVFTNNDWFTTNLLTGGSSYVSNTVDPNSATILSYYNSALGSVRFSINGTTNSVSRGTAVNVATGSTPLIRVTGSSCRYGCFDDAYNSEGTSVPYLCTANCAWRIPWQYGFVEQGTCAYGDCHDEALNTQTCRAYETYASDHYAYTGSYFSVVYGGVHNLYYSWDSQRNGGPDAAGVPYIGTMLWGEDASLAAIDHIIAVSIPGSGGYPVASGGWVKPAAWANHPCRSACSHPLPLGARLRLNRYKYTCPSAVTHPQAHKICVTLQTYGAIVIDWNGQSHIFGPALQPTRSRSNPWNETDVAALNGIPITDFDLMKLGTYYP